MRFWQRKQPHRSQGSYRRLAREVAERDVVRAAEEIVGTVWMSSLTEAEQEAATAQRICADMRDNALEDVRAAQDERDCLRVADGDRDLATWQRALKRVTERAETLRGFARHERQSWAAAKRRQAREMAADHERLRAAGNG